MNLTRARWSVSACIFLTIGGNALAAAGKPPVINTPLAGQTNVPYVNFESTGRWTDGAPYGVIQIFEIPSGIASDTNGWVLLRERDNAVTPALDMTTLHPATLHVIRYRNVTANDDPWATVFFTTAPDSAGHLRLIFSGGTFDFELDGLYPNRALSVETSADLLQWTELTAFVPTTTSTNISVPASALPASNQFFRLSGATPPP
ncbi:MAG TPA: hypothetical protein VHH88_07420 [Verrucomicrobiae bacterium]|nr:hypothetical protein [Verrucomicrobiae bacterium]